MDTQSMLMSAASTPAVVPEHYGHEENVYPVLHNGHTEYADVFSY
jgi:hypothetical protein